jgi:hypothetical protein
VVYAHREDTADHPAYRDWVEETINGGGAYGVSELALSGFTLQLHKYPCGSSGKGVEDRVAASL